MAIPTSDASGGIGKTYVASSTRSVGLTKVCRVTVRANPSVRSTAIRCDCTSMKGLPSRGTSRPDATAWGAVPAESARRPSAMAEIIRDLVMVRSSFGRH